MVLFDTLITFLQNNPNAAYIILFFGSYFETLIGPGFFIHGEIFFYPGAILAGIGVLNIWIVALACISGGILGDSTSYFIGRKYGHAIVRLLFKPKNKYLNLKTYHKRKEWFHKKGLMSIFLARLMGPISWITPFLAGTTKVKYTSFLKYNIPGVIVGIGQILIIGYFLGASYLAVLAKFKKEIFYITLAIIAIIVIYFLHKLDVLKKLDIRILRDLKK